MIFKEDLGLQHIERRWPGDGIEYKLRKNELED
jgi:hypothetical protein